MKVKCLSILLSIFLISLASASYDIGNLSHQLVSSYGPGNDIKGWVNISLDNELAESTISDNNDNKISLLNLLKTDANSALDYTCIPSDCSYDYTTSGTGSQTKSFTLAQDASKVVGLKLTAGLVESIDFRNFTLESTALASCFNQLEIDLFNDGTIDFINNKPASGEGCFLKNYGCFDSGHSVLLNLEVSETPFCQRINLTQSPGFIVGAWLKKVSSVGSEKIKLEIRTTLNDPVGECSISPSNISTSGGEVFCGIDHAVTEAGPYYVCLYKDSAVGTYETKGYVGEDKCGMSGYPPRTESAAYYISAQGKQFASFGAINVTNTLPGQDTFNYLIQRYIQTKYKNNCSAGCVIPMKFTAKTNQNIVLKNLVLKYAVSGFGLTTENSFYELEETSPRISSDFQQLYLDDGNFSVSSSYGNHSFKLYLNDDQLFSDTISVEELPTIQYLTPTTTSFAYPTLFKVLADTTNITKYSWNFGDNTTTTTTSPQVIHTYTETVPKTYTLTITVTDSKGATSTSSFSIFVSSPDEVINTTLTNKLALLTAMNAKIKNFSTFKSKVFGSFLNLGEVGESLSKLQVEYSQSSTDEQFADIITDLLDVSVPTSINSVRKETSIPSFVLDKNIDYNVLEKIGSGTYREENKDAYTDAIIQWNLDNIATTIDFERSLIQYDASEDILVNIFDMTINNKDDSAFLVIRKMADMQMDRAAEEESGYVHIPLSKGTTKISFSTTEEIDFGSLNYFIAPSISDLVLQNPTIAEPEQPKWTVFILIIILLLIIGVVVYVVLQQWYKNKYENYLFKNKNNLYNLIAYIQESKKKGLNESQIRSNLRKSKWTGEQIDYVLRKYAGRRTGMWEFPIDKILNIFKKPEQAPKTNNFGYRRF